MKQLLLFIITIASTTLFAQEESPSFNKWSIELSGGLQKASRPFATDYYVNTPSLGQGSLGVRYMLNDRFGLKGDFGYNSIEADELSLDFQATYLRGSLQGVVNLGHVLRFEDWTQHIGLLFHTGAGYSVLNTEEGAIDDGQDGMMHVMAGITPQFKISERLAFTLDLTLIGNLGQSVTWDGQSITDNRGIKGSIYNYSAGFTYYLGGNEKHVDWAPNGGLKSELEQLQERLAKVETDMIDSDQDGVADYLDREQNTTSGVAVNTKGVDVDVNENGIPDEIEPSLDRRYVNEEDYIVSGTNTQSGLNMEELINKGYVNVYFQFNSDKPQFYSLQAINYLIVYMNENPSANAELIGYSDEIGEQNYNLQLSERRAKRVYDILIAAGVDSGRLSYRGGGEDTSVNKDSAAARQLVRRVTFKLK
ncbi:MAG: OmpA family protein [Bacteroidota bacterium]